MKEAAHTLVQLSLTPVLKKKLKKVRFKLYPEYITDYNIEKRTRSGKKY